MYYEEIFLELSRRQVKYLVIGGIALALHGVLRLTADLDLMLEMGEANLSKFVAAMRDLGYKPKQPVSFEDFLRISGRNGSGKRTCWYSPWCRIRVTS